MTTSGAENNEPRVESISAMAGKGTLTYLALGDSYTIGESVPEPARWPRQLAAALRDRGINLADPRIIAATGWTTDELSDAMDGEEPLGQYDFVTLLIGVNNQYRGRNLGEYRIEFAALLERAIALAGGRADRVLVLSIPDWGVTPFGKLSGRDTSQIARDLDAFNAAAADECAEHAVAFIDITPTSREHGAHLVADDGLHPSAEAYAAWTQLALPYASRLLATD